MTAGPLSSSGTMWYHSLVMDCRSVHTPCACLHFPGSITPGRSPHVGMGRQLITVKLKDSPTPTSASYKDPRGHTRGHRKGFLVCHLV